MATGWSRTTALGLTILGHVIVLTGLGLASGTSPTRQAEKEPVTYIHWMADTRQKHLATDPMAASSLKDRPQTPAIRIRATEADNQQKDSPPTSFQGAPDDPADFTGSLAYRIRQQIRTCWKTSGIPDDRPLIIRIRMTPEGTADGSPEILLADGSLMDDMQKETIGRAIAQCMPLDLPPELYAWWQTIDIDSRDL